MILSSSDIWKCLESGEIVIRPAKGIEKRIGPGSVDFRLGGKFLVFERNRNAYIDPRKRSTARGATRVVTVKRGESFILHPQELVLATTYERLTISNRLLARLEGRSSIGRLGIIVHSTASVFHPGWDGNPTMEIGNLGVMPVALYPGLRICQFTFEQLSSPETQPYGARATDKYYGQREPRPSAIWAEIDEDAAEDELEVGRQLDLTLERADPSGDDHYPE